MGSNKKARVVLQFNEMDFRHRRALEILRQRPRSMSELVVSAILFSKKLLEREFSPHYIRYYSRRTLMYECLHV